MDIAVLGIDLGKTVCSLAGLDATGAVVFRKRLQRFRLLDFLSGLSPCVVAMEVCRGAHHIGRFCLEHGHEPRLMSPLYVQPYVKVHKTDDRDAEGIAEAATRPTMSFVTIKSEEQLDLQSLHRARERLVRNRTRLINQARGLLMERGIRIGTGRHVFQNIVRKILEDPASDLSPRILLLIEDMISELAVVKISMDGRGRYLDNIFIERLWRSLKQEAVYLHELTDGFVAERIISEWITFYNTDRPHTALDKRTPDEAYFDSKKMKKAA
ncbi:MAG: IS110 family transposase [Rhodobacterales bacterium]